MLKDRRNKIHLPKLIGVIHLDPLPGSPKSGRFTAQEILDRVGERAVREARTLEKAGFEGLIVENFGDAPFYKNRVPPETIAAMSVISAAVRQMVKIPVGVNVLRNDGLSAHAIASVTGCEFIRVNILSGIAATDQGLIETDAAELLREKARLDSNVLIFADALVKHAVTLNSRSLELSIEEVVTRSGADAVVLTGATTGRAVDEEMLKVLEQMNARRISGNRVNGSKKVGANKKSKAGRGHSKKQSANSQSGHGTWAPVYFGSGSTPDNIGRLLKIGHGVIVGSTLRQDGVAGYPLDASRIRSFVRAARAKK